MVYSVRNEAPTDGMNTNRYSHHTVSFLYLKNSIKDEGEEAHLADFSFWGLLSLAFATSMDTLATGVIFIPYPEVLWWAVAIIALTCFVFSMTGFILGHIVGTRLRINVNILGGVILILIGVKIFIEGLCS